jgi:hypothetical protein
MDLKPGKALVIQGRVEDPAGEGLVALVAEAPADGKGMGRPAVARRVKEEILVPQWVVRQDFPKVLEGPAVTRAV